MSDPTVSLLSERLDDAEILRFPGLIGEPHLAHAITTKPWNLAPHRGPQAGQAVERRRRLCAALGFDFERLVAPDQIHSHHVVRVRPGDEGAGRFGRDGAVRFVDGLVVDLRGAPLLQLSADCPLILVYDPARPALGTAHASWRGTVGRIAEVLVQALRREFGSDPAALRAAICPCAGPDRYEVGEEVRRVADVLLPDAGRFFPTAGGRLCFDLRAANTAQLVAAGLARERIEVAAPCTMTDPRFYSHRRDGGDTGRFGLVAGLRA